MNNFEIYVKTSALGKTGIHWRRIEREDYQPRIEAPNLIECEIISGENYPITVNDLIDEIKPSLLIFRDNKQKKLLLEITGIESPQRSQRLGRKVLNAIVWIADAQAENEKILRMIAYNAIQNFLGKDFSISEMIQKSIDFYEREEFRVNLGELNKFIEHIQSLYGEEFGQIKSPVKEYLIASRTLQNLEKLAEDLRNYSLPLEWMGWDKKPKEDGILIVVTENLENRTVLHKAGVWRAFTMNAEEPIKLPETELPQKKTSTVEVLQEKLQLHQPNQKIRLTIVLFIVMILILLIILSFQLFHPQFQPDSLHQIQENSPTPLSVFTPE